MEERLGSEGDVRESGKNEVRWLQIEKHGREVRIGG
jgi:hypothetical protein